MRTTINIDDELLKEASRLTGISEKTSIVREALKTLIRLEAGKRLSKLAGIQKNIKDIPRRKTS